MKICTKCGIEKRESEYHWAAVGARRKAACKVCTNKKERVRKKEIYLNMRDMEGRLRSDESALFNPVITGAWKSSND